MEGNPLDLQSMLQEVFHFILGIILKLVGFGFGLKGGKGEFEDEVEFRRKINLRIQKEKSERLPLFEGSLQDVKKMTHYTYYTYCIIHSYYITVIIIRFRFR